MRIAITGSSGLVGSHLMPQLESNRHDVLRIVRRKPRDSDEIEWDPERGALDPGKLDGVEAVIHLAGEGIADGRWDEAKKRRILESRRQPTQLLAKTLAAMHTPPKVLVSASAIGYYGERGDEICVEADPPGSGFLSDVCVEWEKATTPAREAGIRVVNGRTGVVLTPKGGALKPMLMPFKLCAGGVVGSGKQYWSCISLDDLLDAFEFAVVTESLEGPVNFVCPNPCTNAEFTKALGATLNRPTVLPMPAFAARLALGEMANALILTSSRVLPKKLEEAGFSFAHPTVQEALEHVLGATLSAT